MLKNLLDASLIFKAIYGGKLLESKQASGLCIVSAYIAGPTPAQTNVNKAHHAQVQVQGSLALHENQVTI